MEGWITRRPSRVINIITALNGLLVRVKRKRGGLVGIIQMQCHGLLCRLTQLNVCCALSWYTI